MNDSICVCGAGTMGSGIAQVAAQTGFSTTLFDPDQAALDRAAKSIAKNLDGLVSKNKLSVAEKDQILSRLLFVNNLNHCVADIIIEAIVEKIEAKLLLFEQLDSINSQQTIFASNTSSLSIKDIAIQSGRPQSVIGMHFFNPAPIMKLVEIVSCSFTSASTIEKMVALARKMGKEPVLCQDAPGFIVNHVARPFYLEALRLLALGLADMETIDCLMEASGFKMGPFRLMDLIGNDINYAVTCSIYEGLNQPKRLIPSPLQRRKVEAGDLGRKTGKGYYQYP